MRTDISVGIRWLFGQSQLTALAIAVGMINLSTNASTTLLVLYLREAVGDVHAAEGGDWHCEPAAQSLRDERVFDFLEATLA